MKQPMAILAKAKVNESTFDYALRLEKELEQVKDLARFLSQTWSNIDKFVYEHCFDSLMQYPVIQGTANQLNIQRIGDQSFDKDNLPKAVNQLLNN